MDGGIGQREALDPVHPEPEGAVQAEDDENEEEEEPIPSILGIIDDPRRMWLTREERIWATDIKTTVERIPDIDNLPDFMYVQLALICRGDMEDAIRRVYGLQDFRNEYDILDTHQDGCRRLQTIFEYFPKHLLSFRFSPMEGTYILIHDATKLDYSVLTTQDMVDNWMAASYYMHTAMSPDFATIRKGATVIVECQGMKLAYRKEFKICQDMFAQLVAFYPFLVECRCFHTGLVFNLLAAMFRRLLPSLMKDKFQTGFTFEGRLDEYYLVPDVATANTRIMLGLEDALKRRYEHERHFRL